ncbi:hypothetical protein, partial [Clostridium tyrobutyricum]|uniref:hypothetical protein n=1 Tax=Clostridium tyrobutyricum TaxID=1519 RepID=UPI0024315BA8
MKNQAVRNISQIASIAEVTLKMKKQWKNYFEESSYMKNFVLENSMISINRSILEMQKQWKSQFETLNYIKNYEFIHPMGSVGKSIVQIQKQWKNQFSVLNNIQVNGINTIVLQMQEQWKKQFEVIGYINNHMPGGTLNNLIKVTSDSVNMISKIHKQLNIDLKDIKINVDGSVDNADKIFDFNADDLEDEIDKEKSVISTDKDKLNFIANVILFIFLFIVSIDMQIKSTSINLEDSSISQDVNEKLVNLNKDLEYGLDNVLKFSKFAFILSGTSLKAINNFASNNPLIYDFIKVIICKIYSEIKRLRERKSSSYEILNDRKRNIKFLKREICLLVKKKYDDETIEKLFCSNFRLVNHKSLDVRTGDRKSTRLNS